MAPLTVFTNSNDPFHGIQMGYTVKDAFTGFVGKVIARAEYLTGCNQVFVVPTSKDETKMQEGYWLDVQRLDIMIKVEAQTVSRYEPSGRDIPQPTKY